MIDKKLEEAINRQINMEFSAAYAYLGMSLYFDERNLDGFARWMQMQHDEENEHAMKLFRYLQDRGGSVQLDNIPKPTTEFDSIKAVFEASLDRERENTASINQLYELASNLNDHATKSHLQWFIDEQVEEEKSIEDILALLEMAENDSSALLYLNDKLGARQVEGDEG